MPTEAVNRTIKMPARESYRKPYDAWNSERKKDSEFHRHIKITVSPATFPYPLLKYRFNTYSTELESGNAAPLYSQAGRNTKDLRRSGEKLVRLERILRVEEERRFRGQILGELFRAVPLGPAWPNSSYPKSVSPEEEAKFYKSMAPVYQLLEKASRIRDRRLELLHGIQGDCDFLGSHKKTRGLARYLGGKADWEIRNGKYEDAVKTLRIGIAMGNHVGESEFPHAHRHVGRHRDSGNHAGANHDPGLAAGRADLYPALTQIILPADAFQYAMQGEPFCLFPHQTPCGSSRMSTKRRRKNAATDWNNS